MYEAYVLHFHLMLDATGRFFFRTRNVLFPAIFLILVAAATPRAFGDHFWDKVAGAGLVAILAGQSLRVITIGLDYVKRGGKKKKIYADRLVTAGVYAHCRNPMYVGNLLVAIGLLLVIGQPLTIALGTAFFVLAYVAIVASEERYLIERFGEEYREYCRRSPRWVPRVHGLIATLRAYRFDWPAVIVKEYGTLFTTLTVTTLLLAWKAHRAEALGRTWGAFVIAIVLWTGFFIVARWLKKAKAWKPRGTTPLAPTLHERRQRIDAIDASILDLLNQRAEQVKAIFKDKAQSGLSRFDPDRTEQILQQLERRNRGPLTNAEVRSLYSSILRMFAQEFQREHPRESSSPRDMPIVEVFDMAVPTVR